MFTFVAVMDNDFLMELRASRRLLPDYRAAYCRLSHTLSAYLHERTAFTRLRLVGTFAKMDYLLKEISAAPELVQRANSARVRLRRCMTMSEEEIRRWYEADYEAVGNLIGPPPRPPRWGGEPSGASNGCHFALPPNGGGGGGLRLLVTSWDDNFIYGRADDAAATPLRVSYLLTGSDFDGTYLRGLLYEGVQLNLVRPTEEGGVWRAEHIIVEPDVLVNITTVAHCFATYAESPLVYLVDLLRPSAESEHIALGNLAGEMLDAELHSPAPYKDVLRTFFRHSALSLLTTPLPDDFHQRAQEQLAHIHDAIHETLPQHVASYRRENIIVEPSFFCETLGLQGRMDMLDLDGRLLIEQKAGRGGWPQEDADTPRAAEQHYVQMLLYMAVLRYGLGQGRELHAFLLYSKYRNSLLGLGYAPELVYRALRLRNGIVWLMRHLARGGSRLLDTLTPEALNKKNTKGRLWEEYTRPELSALLEPFRTSSPLARMYFHRMTRFVATEQMLSRLGNKTKANSGFAAAWHYSLGEKLESGAILLGRSPTPPAPPRGGGSKVTYKAERPQTDFVVTLTLANALPAQDTTPPPSGGGRGGGAVASSFRPGDIVILYPYPEGQEPDLRRTIVHRGTLTRLTATEAEVTLRNAQTDASIFLRHKDEPWAIEPDLMESASSGLYRGLYSLLTAPSERRDLILGQRHPRVDASLRLRGDYGRFNDLALRVKQARELFLIIGPPGTGKTSFGMLTTVKEELRETGTSVLLLSYTNRAVDEICSKLVEEGIDFLRLGSAARCAEPYRPHLLESRLAEATRLDELRGLIKEARVVVATTTTLTAHLNLLQLHPFTLTVIDEASQILEPQLMGILAAPPPPQGGEGVSAWGAACGRLVLIGDHKQLPAVVAQSREESEVEEAELRAIGLTNCGDSLFERLLRLYADDPTVTYMLTRQGRMHAAIAAFPNRAFYEGRLSEAGLPHQTAADDDLPRLAFYHVPTPDLSPSDKVNPAEADLIACLCAHIYNKEKATFQADDTLGIIVPYRNQITTIRQALSQRGLTALADVAIDTVERYQGSQRRYIIYGTTVQRAYQMRFLTSQTFEEHGHLIDRKLNVAMTRAKEHLLIVGNRDVLRASPVYAKLVEEYSDCRAGRTGLL